MDIGNGKNKNQNAPRPPVVVVLGHVDHGKSTLLDYIRKTHSTDAEAGGITQHIGAYEGAHKKDGETRPLTFIDTPGHEAFSAMRTRGLKAADVAVLVVSAEEGVKTQTMEAREKIERAKIPFIVVINKIDKPDANIDRAKQSLAEAGILVEGYGGKIPCVAVSAKTGQGVDELLDIILLAADLENLTGNKESRAAGVVVESHLDSRVGAVVTLIIKDGSLRRGDFVVVDGDIAKVRKLEDYTGKNQEMLFFSSPARVFGFAKPATVGEVFNSFSDKKEAEDFVSEAKKGVKGVEAKKFVAKKTVTNRENGEQESVAKGTLPIILKADTSGTLEALADLIKKREGGDPAAVIVARAVGPITERDIKHASTDQNAVVIGFHVKVEKSARDLAERLGVKAMSFDVIYRIDEWLDEETKRREPKTEIDSEIGQAKVLKIFSRTKDRQVIGGAVLSGKIIKGPLLTIIRREAEIGKGKVMNLEHGRQTTSEVVVGSQFGMMIESKIGVAAGDVLSCRTIS